MKSKIIQLSVFFIILCVTFAYTSENPKILVLIADDVNLSQSIEPLIAKHLSEAGYQIVTSDELTLFSELRNDISDVRKGDLLKVKKAAIACGANFIFIASVRNEITSKELMGLNMHKSCVTLSYKIIDTVTDKIIKRDTIQNVSTGRTPEIATNTSFNNIAGDISGFISKNLLSRSSPAAISDESESETVVSSSEPKDTFPKIAIISPAIEGKRSIGKSEKTVINETFTIKGQVTDQRGVESVRINDQPVIFDDSGYFSYNTELAAGDNRFVVTAMNIDGKTASKDFVITKESGIQRTGAKPVLWVLTIGVSRYEKSSMSFRYADADALILAEFLKKQEGKLFSEIHCKTLVNENVTRDSILENISSHLGKAAPDDVIFIFLAGHGIKHSQSGSYYFFPFDATLNTVVSKGMRMSDFEEAVKILSKNTNVGKLILAIDTCHSGSLDIGLRAESSGENLAEALKESTGQFILAASKGGEPSVEDSKYRLHDNDSGHGVFTYSLINGMQGKANYDGDDYISLGELFQYVAKQIPRLTEGLQHPYFRMSGTDMPLVFLEK